MLISLVIKMNFNGDAEVGMETECDDSYQGDNQYRYADELSSFHNDVTPDKINERDQYEVESYERAPEANRKVTIFGLFSSARFSMATLSSALSYFSYAMMEPILAIRLAELSLTPIQIGIFFTIWPTFFITSSLAVQHLPTKVDKRVTLMLSAFFSALSFFFVGPSDMVNLPESVVIMGIG